MTDTATHIELVRHAKAQRRDRWWGRPDRERPLTKSGFAQARQLADELASSPVDRIITSPFTRCVQTVEPLAERLDLELEYADALGEVSTVPVVDQGDPWVSSAWLGGRALALVDEVVAAASPGGCALLCSHGDVVPSLMATLVGRDALEAPDVHRRKGARFRLTFKGPKCVAIEAVPPP